MKEYLETGTLNVYYEAINEIYLSEYEDSRRFPIFVQGNISQYVNRCNKFKGIKLNSNKKTIKEDCIFYAYLSYKEKRGK